MKKGRPTEYSEELADRICELVAINPVGLPSICDKYPELPTYETIRVWRWTIPSFSDKYTRAKQFQAEIMAESIEEVIEEAAESVYIDVEGVRRIDSGMLMHARLKIDSRKWQASKLAPKIYGDRSHVHQQVTVTHEETIEDLNE